MNAYIVFLQKTRSIFVLLVLTLVYASPMSCARVPDTKPEIDISAPSCTSDPYPGIDPGAPQIKLDGPVQVVLTTHFEGPPGSFDLTTKSIELEERIAEMRKSGPTTKVSIDLDHEVIDYKDETILAPFRKVLGRLKSDGHSIGLHGSFCGKPGTCTDDKIKENVTNAYTKLKTRVIPDIQHLSGVCSDADWVEAATNSGLPLISGVVRHCRLSLSSRNPMALGAGDCPTASDCHGPYRYKLERLLHPLRASDGANWTEGGSSDGALIATQVSSFKDMDSMYAVQGGHPGNGKPFVKSSSLNEDDVEAVCKLLNMAIIHASTHRKTPEGTPVVHTFVIGSSWGTYLDKSYDEFYKELAKIVHDNPNLIWANLGELE